MQFKSRSIKEIAAMICGDFQAEVTRFVYRSSSRLTDFFHDCGLPDRHDGSTRAYWVAELLKRLLDEPHANAQTLPPSFCRVIANLMAQEDATNESSDRAEALALLNASLKREGFEAFYGEDSICYLRHLGSQAVVNFELNPHRPFTKEEMARRAELVTYLDFCSEDELIEEILLPMFRQLGFRRITAPGHKDKALEFGKDLWMKYTLPTQHILYFGIQAKKGKIDSAGQTKTSNANVAEIHTQALMMLGHEIFDPEIGKEVLVDHAFIVAGGEITKAARHWIGKRLDASKRSQIMFMDRADIMNLYIVTSLAVPRRKDASGQTSDDLLPF